MPAAAVAEASPTKSHDTRPATAVGDLIRPDTIHTRPARLGTQAVTKTARPMTRASLHAPSGVRTRKEPAHTSTVTSVNEINSQGMRLGRGGLEAIGDVSLARQHIHERDHPQGRHEKTLGDQHTTREPAEAIPVSPSGMQEVSSVSSPGHPRRRYRAGLTRSAISANVPDVRGQEVGHVQGRARAAR